MKHATTRMIFAYWDLLRGERAAPERGEIEPGEIRHVLGDTFILEAAPDGAAIRLAGTRICALFGRELKGHAFASLWAANSTGDPQALLDIVLGDTAVCIAGLVGRTEYGEEMPLEMILLPLRHGGKPHARILGALTPLTVPAWIGLRPLQGLATRSMRVIPGSGPMGAVSPEAPRPAPPEARRPALTLHRGGRI